MRKFLSNLKPAFDQTFLWIFWPSLERRSPCSRLSATLFRAFNGIYPRNDLILFYSPTHQIFYFLFKSDDEKTPLFNDNEAPVYGTRDVEADVKNNNAKTTMSCFSKLRHSLRHSDIMKVLGTKECLLCCVLFVLFATVDIGFEEMFPIIASTSPKYKGMGFDPSDVGLVLMIVSIVQILFQLTLLPKLSTRIGPQRFLIISCVVQAIFSPCVPALASMSDRTVMWACLIAVIFVMRTSVFTGYLSINILVNNSVGVDIIGSANGVTMTASYLGRLTAPVLCGGMYSWSLKNIRGIPGNNGALGFPFDQFLTFFFMSAVCVVCAVVTAMLPKRMNYVDPQKWIKRTGLFFYSILILHLLIKMSLDSSYKEWAVLNTIFTNENFRTVLSKRSLV